MGIISDYYKNNDVRARIMEFIGGAPEDAACQYLVAHDTSIKDNFRPRPTETLWACLDAELDVERSLWDKRALIIDLDVEYVNFDFPFEPYLDPGRTFQLQQPVENVIRTLLLEFGIVPLHLMSGRGHHFTWRVERDSPAFEQMAKFATVPDFLETFYAKPHPPHGRPVDPDLMRAFSGLGMVMEYIAHLIKERAAPLSVLPVELTAVTVGPVQRGREMISVDISEYGDPLNMRSIRIPYSVYWKPWQQRSIYVEDFLRRMPPLFLLPRDEMGLAESLESMRRPQAAALLAGRASARIPEQSQGTRDLVAAYRQSELAAFHEWFYSEEHEPPGRWAATYDQLEYHTLPPCVQYVLRHPNAYLLMPAGLALVTRVLLAQGWHPRHIAGFIRSIYERDHGWGLKWYEYNAGMRADFYTRVFSGLFYTGRDDLLDFNCQSMREKNFCFRPNPGCNLAWHRDALLERREHERLGDWPFHGVLQSDTHR